MDQEVLLTELRTLCKGRGAQRADLRARFGQQLATQLAISDVESSTAVRTKLVEAVRRWSADLPPDDQLVVLAAMGLHAGAGRPTLSGRLDWVAANLNYAQRTARRRLDEALHFLAGEARAEAHAVGDPADPESGWRLQELNAVLRLGARGSELYERRKITAVRDGLDTVVARFGVPRSPVDWLADRELVVEPLYGVQLGRTERVGDESFKFELSLPRRLARGDTYEYGLIVRLSAGQPMAPHFVLTPLSQFESFSLTVRFDLERPPSVVWCVSNGFLREVDCQRTGVELLHPDKSGEVHVSFENMRQGLCYGVAWAFE